MIQITNFAVNHSSMTTVSRSGLFEVKAVEFCPQSHL